MSKSDQELLAAIKHAFDELIPFNKVLGTRIQSIEEGRPTVRFEMREELIGNYLRGNLHGGVISGVMDATGGLTAFRRGVDRQLSARQPPRWSHFRCDGPPEGSRHSWGRKSG